MGGHEIYLPSSGPIKFRVPRIAERKIMAEQAKPTAEQIKLLKELLELPDVEQLEKLSGTIAGLSILPPESTAVEKRKFHAIRGVVLDCHIAIDLVMGFLLTKYFTTYLRSTAFMEMVLPKITFDEKKEIIKKLKLTSFTKSNWDALDSINTIRNTFAHGYPIDHPRFLYKGDKSKHIFKNSKIIKEFESDVFMIIRELSKVEINYLNTAFLATSAPLASQARARVLKGTPKEKE